jgi:nucleoid-associated protein
MKGIRKNDVNIQLKGMVIHQVIKEAGNRTTYVKEANNTLPISEREKLFISKIYKAYFDNSKPIYGIFEEQDNTFKNRLSQYLNDDKFFEFSKDATQHFKNTLMKSTPSTGGYLIFAHFKHVDKGFDYMVVMTMTNKDNYAIESDLSLSDIKSLDLSKIDVGCMINLSKWKEIESLIIESSSYLSFAKGEKEVSYYFMSFIDCSNKTTKTESTNRFKKAFEDYCSLKGYNREERIQKRNEIYGYCIGCIDEKREISLSAISAFIDPDNTDEFEKFAADDKYCVSSIINADKSLLKTMKYIVYKDDDYKIEFDAALITKGKVYYDKAKNQLTFKNIPEKLAMQIPD